MRHGGHFDATVLCTPRFIDVGADRLLGPKGCGKDLRRGHAFVDQGAGDGQCALRRQLEVVSKTAVAVAQQGVVGEATHHQHFLALAQVDAQRLDQAFEQLAAVGAQFIRTGSKQHAAADANAAIAQGDAAAGQRAGQGVLQGHAALLFLLTFFDLVLEAAHQVHLHHQHAHQDQHESAQQARHQVTEHGPNRRRLLHGVVPVVQVHHRAAPSAEAWALPCRRRRSSTMPCWELMLRSMTSRAWAT